jgi:hypothetical protein
VFCPKKSTCCIVGASEVLGPMEYWGVELIALTVPALNFCSNSKIEPC